MRQRRGRQADLRRLRSIDKEFVRKGAKGISDKDIEKVTQRADEIKKKVKSKGPLNRFIEDVKLLLDLIKDYWNGNYRKIPYWAIGAAAFTLLYILNPIDIIPDFIPVVGQIDDAAVVGVCMLLLEQELHDYKAWRDTQAKESD
ncbi:MAG: DUF1232 domain-containing protein [candidate division Zixibacteria bacterium]|nr:DUF1232 domain-containing protein [candidate division Zixibacteria bacterium]